MAGFLCLSGMILMCVALYMPAKAQFAQILMQRAWASSTPSHYVKPWPWADFTPIGKLHFPDQKQSVMLVSDAAGEALAFGPSLMAASVPLGQSGVSVIAAHRDTHFRFLDKLTPGERIEIDTLKGLLRYQVTHSEVVKWNMSGIHPHDGGTARLALVTCWPLHGKLRGDDRYIVWAERIGPA